MPAKYSHVKKRTASGLLKKSGSQITITKDSPHHHNHHHHHPQPKLNPHIDRALSAVSLLERAIAKILLIRYEQDIARLFSTRLYSISLVHLPTFVMRCTALGGPGWLAWNYESEEVKDFMRAAISMDMRQAGERVATKSVLWSYTALRHFALSNNVPICQKRGLHSLRLLPHYPLLKAHLDTLESLPPATFTKPPHLGSLQDGLDALEEACDLKYSPTSSPKDPEFRFKLKYGYEKVAQTLWSVAREFDVRGYGTVLREKLTAKWCDCGCSTDHLGEVCERTVREEEEDGKGKGKGGKGKYREWDGRGSGVYGWETGEEEDVWDVELDFGGEREGSEGEGESEFTIGEMMEWRYFRAEKEKEEGNKSFRKGDFQQAVKHYESAHSIEPELPHYQLNLAAAYLKLNNWIEAEHACTKALSQHRSEKGYYRRAKARKMLDRVDEAIQDLRAVLRLRPTNMEAMNELSVLLPPPLLEPVQDTPSSSSSSSHDSSSSSSSSSSQSSSSSPHKPPCTSPSQGRPSKQPRPPPFAKTKMDERRLKIMPLTAAPDHGCECRARGKHGRGHEQEEGVPWPSWERYVVKRVD